MKDRSEEQVSASVSDKTKQAGEVRARWAWTEPQAWTERMLTTLEQGVKGGKWFSLVDKVYSPAVLKTAFARVEANGGAPGVDRQTIEMFKRRLDDNLAYLSEQLQKGTYRPLDPANLSAQPRQLREATPGDTHPTRSAGPDGYAVVSSPSSNKTSPIKAMVFARAGCSDALRRVVGLLENGNVWWWMPISRVILIRFRTNVLWTKYAPRFRTAAFCRRSNHTSSSR